MTHTTDPRPAADAATAPAGTTAAAPARWASARVSALAAGAVAAGLGLAVPAVAALALWIGSPYPDNGLGGALHIGAGLWLLAQGAELVRTDTLSGDPAPIALTPLLLAAVPAWLLHRAASSVLTPDEDPSDPSDTADPATPDVREAAAVVGWVLAGYLAVAAVAVGYAAGGPVHVDPLSALYVPLFAAVAAACGAWTGSGRPPLAGWLGVPVPRPYAEEAADAVRAAAAGGAVLLGGGALVAAVALVLHTGAVAHTYGQLSGPYPGRIAVLLVALALVPNLVVWAASYAVGTGFTVGAGSVVAPAGATGYPLLPAFPLLAALPGAGPSGPLGWATLAVPVAAGLAVGWSLAGARTHSLARTLRATLGAAVLTGAGFALTATLAGGALGHSAMASFGPFALRGALALTAWLTLIALPTTLLLHYHHPRGPN